MWILPLLAALVAAAFAVSLHRMNGRRPGPGFVLWAASMWMYAIGCAALAAGVAGGFTATEFQLYWAFGAVLNVPFLAAGEIELLARDPRVRRWLLAVLALVTIWTLFVTFGAPTAADELARDLPSGKAVFGDGSSAHRLPQLISIPAYLVLLLGTLWSAWRMRGRRELRDRFYGTLAIAGGATVIAGFGSAFAALGMLVPFSVSILAGVGVMFQGFRIAVRRRPA